jgi:hypothetical protein
MFFFAISHPYIITPLEDVHISRPPEHGTLNEIVAEEHKNHQWLDMTGRLRRIRDHVLVIIGGSVVERESAK